MPVYEYLCSNCHNQFEKLQKFSDEPVKTCPECGGSVEKLISSTAFALKGDGWFNTGYCPKTEAKKPAECSAGGCACKE